VNPDFSNPIEAPPSPHPALGIDYGAARIGIAATDEFGIMAHPVETIPTDTGNAIGRITQLAAQRKIRTLVVGLPLRLDGSEGSSALRVRQLANQLRAALPAIPLVFQDETYTTATASEKMREAGRKAHQQKQLIDQLAAVEILNLWMGEPL
jgi:putative holliday junction resolvase